MNRIHVIGIGNPLLGDDGLGIAVIEQLQQLELPPGIKLIDGGCGGLQLLHLCGDCEQLILIDAADFGGRPGEIKQLKAAELPAAPPARSRPLGHHFALPEILLLAQFQPAPPEISLFLMQTEDCRPGADLSLPVQVAMPRLLSAVSQQFQRLSQADNSATARARN